MILEKMKMHSKSKVLQLESALSMLNLVNPHLCNGAHRRLPLHYSGLANMGKELVSMLLLLSPESRGFTSLPKDQNK